VGRVFTPARWQGAGAPEIQSMTYDGSQDFIAGAVMVAGSTNAVKEASADPVASIVGVALEREDAKPGWELGHSTDLKQVTGRVGEVSVAKANRNTVFSGVGTSAAAASQIGTDYGLVDTSGEWQVDLTDESNVAVMVVDVDVDNNIIFFKFLEAVLLNP
jgi:hypothetical protein